LAIPDEAICLHDTPACGQEERHCEIGGCVGQNAGRVGHLNSQKPTDLKVNVVHPHGDLRDKLQPGSCRIQNPSVQVLRQLNHRDIVSRQLRKQLAGRGRSLSVRGPSKLTDCFQPCKAVTWHGAGQIDLRSHEERIEDFEAP
jgi:hypothetical protein